MQISDESGIKATKDLGKYLGMPVLQKRINKDTFGDILEKMSSRLSGWKGRCLSFAGRITLTKAVLTSIPVHTMSTICLPKSVLEKIDQLARTFLWGSKQHIVAWNKVVLPKSEGGLGIRSAQEMNKALIAKLGWRLIQKVDSLWVSLVRKKYKVGDIQDASWLVAKSNWSSTWRSIVTGLRGVILPGNSWVLGDGRIIKFWSDRWLFNKRLADIAVRELPLGYEAVRVQDMWRDGMGWDMNRISPYISENTRLELLVVVPDRVTGARDRLSWGESGDGSFSVKTAYGMLTRNELPRQNLTTFYDRIWRVVGPERVRTFLWMVGNQALLTNEERHGRHLCATDLCQVCKSGVETTIHILRDCPAMAGLWARIIPRRRRNTFFATSLLEWVFDNLGDDGAMYGSIWSTVFAMAVWWGWKWRCGNVFNNNGKCRDRVRFIKDLAQEVTLANLKHRASSDQVSRVEVMIGWVAPQAGWVKLNTDGASRGNPGTASAGGVLRDEDGSWCGGFGLNIGRCTAPLAELWGVYYGLYIAWERNITRLELEVDSQVVVGFLTTGISDMHPLSFLVRLCHGFLSRDWIVRITHVYREANRLADGLANYAFTLPLGFHLFSVAPQEVVSLLSDDVIGSARPKRILV